MLCLAMAAAIILADNASNYTLIPMSFAQSGNITSPLNKTQEWISQKDAVKILFTYQPERPIIDTFTKLKFRVINLTSNENLNPDWTHQVSTRIDKGISVRASFNQLNHGRDQVISPSP